MAVTANQLITVQNPGNEGLISYPVATGIHIYQGTLTFLIAASGYLTDDDAAGANAFAGIATEEVDNTGADGALRCECRVDGTFELVGSGLTQALVGDKIYATDNYTVTGSSATASLIGRCVEFVSATRIAVKIEVGTQA